MLQRVAAVVAAPERQAGMVVEQSLDLLAVLLRPCSPEGAPRPPTPLPPVAASPYL